MKKWTIAFVNYKTTVYLNWQLKILYEHNNPEDFDLIIVDNSRPFEKERLEELTKPYNQKYNNIRIFYNTPVGKIDSEQHGEGMNVAVKNANSQYFLAQDPDFFFVKKNYLNFLENLLETGMVAVGAPYHYYIGCGHPKFPSIWGAAYPLELIKNLDYRPDYSKESVEKYKHENTHPFEVGYQFREALSTAGDDSNFISFEYEDYWELSQKIGEHSFDVVTKKYLYEKEIVAYHLFRGSFTDVPVNACDINATIDKRKLVVRNKIGEFFYKYISRGKPPKLFSLKYIINKYKFLNKMVKIFYQNNPSKNYKRILGIKINKKGYSK